ncbi:unnamed protein product [Cercopithifilaria johnstoni]|uniref:C2 domain-containing protein n=1 Tax=Cercopithifilaria johnstoni TaxID=2874296 RepID=A0A8J2LWT2_9BILA|nr:unnamed protein product [Cercopithifilaria johnstoni]
MRLLIASLLLSIFYYVLSAEFWTDIRLKWIEWSNNCDLHNICIQPTLQLRLINLFNNETIIKILRMNFDQQQQTGETHLISFWSEGVPDMIVSTITINGIDPDYDFSRLCDSSGTIFLFRFAGMNRTEMSGTCFKAKLTFTKYFDQCSHMTKQTIDQTYGKTLQTSLTVVVCCLIIFLVLTYIFIIINRILKLRSKSDSQMQKRISISKASIFNDGSLNAAENLCECVKSRVFPISSLHLTKSQIIKFSPKHTVSANSSLCGSIG